MTYLNGSVWSLLAAAFSAGAAAGMHGNSDLAGLGTFAAVGAGIKVFRAAILQIVQLL
jgi:hypothetical protein